MRIIRLQQNSPEWERWRNEPLSVGASDAPAICGVDKYTSPRMLFDEKLNGKKRELGDFLLEKARTYEERGHAMSGLVLNREYERNVCGEHDEFRNIKASFDGINFEECRFWENKYVGLKDFESVQASPKKISIDEIENVEARDLLKRYSPQLAQQAFVSGFRRCDFTAYNDQVDTVSNIEIEITNNFVEGIIEKVFGFVDLLKLKVLPPISHLDTYEVTNLNHPVICAYFSHLLDAVKSGNKTAYRFSRERIIGHLPHTRVECMGVKITKTKTGRHIFMYPPGLSAPC